MPLALTSQNLYIIELTLSASVSTTEKKGINKISTRSLINPAVAPMYVQPKGVRRATDWPGLRK